MTCTVRCVRKIAWISHQFSYGRTIKLVCMLEYAVFKCAIDVGDGYFRITWALQVTVVDDDWFVTDFTVLSVSELAGYGNITGEKFHVSRICNLMSNLYIICCVVFSVISRRRWSSIYDETLIGKNHAQQHSCMSDCCLTVAGSAVAMPLRPLCCALLSWLMEIRLNIAGGTDASVKFRLLRL